MNESESKKLIEKFHDLERYIEEVSLIASKLFYSSNTVNSRKSDGTVVTETDIKIEQKLRIYIKENFPGDTIIGEEGDNHDGVSGYVWHVDPIDGTDNFLRRIPFFAISVARLGEDSHGSFAVVYNPISRQRFSTFTEEIGNVYENEMICLMSPEPLGTKYVIALGRTGKESWMKPAGYKIQEKLGQKYGRCGAMNCASLELAYVAANRIDAFITFGLSSYDYAGGVFLAKSAGAQISVFEDNKWRAWSDSIKKLCDVKDRIIFVSHPDMHQEFLEEIGNPTSLV